MDQPTPDPGLQEVLQLLDDAQGQLSVLRQKLSQLGPIDEQLTAKRRALEVASEGESRHGTVIEGVFDGQQMIGPDAKVYTVPANYASKSKLVEGDILKLTIAHDGSFIYKQIGPVERQRQQGTLVLDETTGNWKAVITGGRSYRLLTASVTYHKGQAGDTVIMLTPQHMPSTWSAVETILPSGTDQTTLDEWFTDPEEAAQLYGDLKEDDVISGAALLEDGAHGQLPPMHDMLPPEQSELSAPAAATPPPATAYADGSKPFVAPSV